MMLKQIITIGGNPYSGINIAGEYLKNKYGFACKSYNYPVDDIYNDLKRIFKFESYQRFLAKVELIMKHSASLAEILGGHKEWYDDMVFKWLTYVEREEKELFVKRVIYEDLTKLNPDWRKLIIQENLSKSYCSGIILLNPFTVSETEYNSETLCLWIKTPRYKCYQHAWQKNVEYENKIFNRLYLEQLRLVKDRADFEVNNIGTKEEFYKELDLLMKGVLHFESTQ